MRAFCPDQRRRKGQQAPEAAQTTVPPVIIVEEREEAHPRTDDIQSVAAPKRVYAQVRDPVVAVIPEVEEANDTCPSSSTPSAEEDEESMDDGQNWQIVAKKGKSKKRKKSQKKTKQPQGKTPKKEKKTVETSTEIVEPQGETRDEPQGEPRDEAQDESQDEGGPWASQVSEKRRM